MNKLGPFFFAAHLESPDRDDGVAAHPHVETADSWHITGFHPPQCTSPSPLTSRLLEALCTVPVFTTVTVVDVAAVCLRTNEPNTNMNVNLKFEIRDCHVWSKQKGNPAIAIVFKACMG